MVGPNVHRESIERSGVAATLHKTAEDKMWEGKPILLRGKMGVGKTQLATDVCCSMGLRVLVPKKDALEQLSTALWTRWFSKKGCILLLDDLHTLVHEVGPATSVMHVISEMVEQGGSVLSTCPIGSYDQLVEWHLDNRLFEIVDVPVWSPSEGKVLADALGIDFDPNFFDGTPASLIQGYEPKRMVYRSLDPDARKVLRAMKLLYLAGMLTAETHPSIHELRDAANILQISDFDEGLQKALGSGLIERLDGDVWSYVAVMEEVVKDFPTDDDESWRLIRILGESFVQRRKFGELFDLAAWSYASGRNETAEGLLSDALESRDLDPGVQAEFLAARAIVRHAVGDYGPALRDIQAALARDPENRDLVDNAQIIEQAFMESVTELLREMFQQEDERADK